MMQIDLTEGKDKQLDKLASYSDVLLAIMCVRQMHLHEEGFSIPDSLEEFLKDAEDVFKAHISEVLKGFSIAEKYRLTVQVNVQKTLLHAEIARDMVARFGHKDIAEQANKVFVEATKLRKMFG